MRTFLPLSGYEPLFSEGAWATEQGIKNNNCYDYAVDSYSNARVTKTVTGDRARKLGVGVGLKNRFNQDSTCRDVKAGLMQDHAGMIYREASNNPCKPGYTKISMFTGSDGDGMSDFHFCRQNGNILYTIHLAEVFSIRKRDVVRANNMHATLVPSKRHLVSQARLGVWTAPPGQLRQTNK